LGKRKTGVDWRQEYDLLTHSLISSFSHQTVIKGTRSRYGCYLGRFKEKEGIIKAH
jgi:hypothetical protein